MNNKDLQNHTVQVMHKCVSGNTLAVGQTFRFRSGSAYQVKEDGSVRSNKIKLTKSQRRQQKRARQLDRALATANLCTA